MSDISAITSLALAMNQSRNAEQLSISILKENARAEQAIAALLAQNARQIKALAQNISTGNIDLFV